jgi:hypothetical protein
MTISISVFAYDSTVFTVESVEKDGIVTVEISYAKNVFVQSGALDLVYDNAKLSVKEVAKSELMEKATCLINEKYDEDTIRLAWITSSPMPESGEIVTVKFDVIDGEFKSSDLSIENFSVGNKNGQKLKDATISIKGVENSAVDKDSSSDLTTPDTNDKTDEMLPVDKAETDDKAEETAAFSDVAADDWFFESVNYAKENGLMSGVSSTEFAPEESVTRAMLVVVLHRLEGTPPPAKSSEFADVESGQWYTDGIAWAAEKGIVNGVEDDKFAPDAKITREQIAAIMHRYAVYKGYDVSVGESTNILSYDDFDKISEYAIAPVQWAVGSGLVKGKTASTLNPEDNATRAEIAVILHRFIEANTK